ncbi:MAG: aminotransferase class I/II-fold pyridoxal phosphate-dependent enzyme [Clostridiales bacterium]|jgi:aminotransferase|nr:aminotransferase class I/II-fold pyridoxal phosphate-dependent enzyme [Clostridiales bacterium]
MSFVTPKIQSLPYSGIRRFFDVANEMTGVISLGVGEPDFLTPWNVREEAIFHLEKRRTVYSSNAGLLPLRREISSFMSRRYNLTYSPEEQVLVTVGGSEAIDLVLRAVIEPGDEVIYHEPCYVSYMPCVTLAGGVPVPVETKEEDCFRLAPETLEAAITPRTKAVILSFPNNPTGAVMSREDLEKIAGVLKDRDILVISDEIYSELAYGREPHVSIANIPEIYGKTLVINGFSKAFAMTGWRLGYACGPADLIAAMTKIHQYAIMCAPTTSQYAGIEALRGCGRAVAEMRLQYDARRRVMRKGFLDMGLSCFEPFGAFYCFPSIKSTGLSTEDFCRRLLFEGKVAVVPGTAFGACGEGFVRCSYAYSIDSIKTALKRIEEFLGKI